MSDRFSRVLVKDLDGNVREAEVAANAENIVGRMKTKAEDVPFEDGETLQEKFDAGKLGSSGKSPYDQAVEGGYTGTEEEFAKILASGPWLPKRGGDMAGNVDMNNHVITGLPTPVAPSDAVNYQTLLNAIAGVLTFAQITVTGIDGSGGEVSMTGVASVTQNGTFGTETVLRIKGEVSGINTKMQNVTDVKVTLPNVYSPPSDWSYLPGYQGLLCKFDSGYDVYLALTGSTKPLTYTLGESGFVHATQKITLDGNVKVGVSA